MSCGDPTCSRDVSFVYLTVTVYNHSGNEMDRSLGSMEISPDISKYFVFSNHRLLYLLPDYTIYSPRLCSFFLDRYYSWGWCFLSFPSRTYFFNVKIKSKILCANLIPEFRCVQWLITYCNCFLFTTFHRTSFLAKGRDCLNKQSLPKLFFYAGQCFP